MKKFYSTNLCITNFSRNSLISTKLSKLSRNNRTVNFPINRSYKDPGYKEQQKSELNLYFPHHIFNKFSTSFDNNFTNKKMNIPFQIDKLDNSIKESEISLQEIWHDEVNEYYHKLKYGSEFFIKFAKLKKDMLETKMKRKSTDKKKDQCKHRFLKNMFKPKKEKKINFFDILIKETEISNTSNSRKKKIAGINENEKLENDEIKILSNNILPTYNTERNIDTTPKNSFFTKRKISQKNKSHDNNMTFNKSNIGSMNIFKHVRSKKQKHDLSKLKFPYFPEIIGKKKMYKLFSSKKFTGKK